jgi:hypothetical protein
VLVIDRARYEPRAIIAASLRCMVRRFDADLLSPDDAAELMDWFAEVERLAVAGKTLAARRAVEGEPWLESGDRSAADWLAKRTGSTVGESRAVLDTGVALQHAPLTDKAFRSGSLSLKKAEALATAGAADPTAESRLLELAGSTSLQKLRDECARVRAAADPDPGETHARARRGRFWRRWTDPEGGRCGMYRLPVEEAAALEAAAQPFIDAVIDAARRDGRREPSEAYAADGLVAMAKAVGHDEERPSARGGRGRRRMRDRRELIGLVNVESLRRGSVEAGEMCEIAGIGPVPLDIAREVFGDAVLRIVIRDGVDVRTVVHTGRTASAVQETAVLVRDGGRCRRPRCDLPISEIDHVEGFTKTRQTTLDDLAGLCAHDHDLKTRGGHSYRITAEGRVEWTRPDGVTEYEHPPP